MNLKEILNTKPDVTWTSDGHKHRAEFSVDDEKYMLQVDEYDYEDKLILDVGFTRTTHDSKGSIDAVAQKIGQSRVMGVVLNCITEKLKELKPDAVLLTVDHKSGLVDSRKSLYDSMVRWIQRRSDGFTITVGWIENTIKTASYMLIGKNEFTAREVQEFVDVVVK